jgi:hypothetical protein
VTQTVTRVTEPIPRLASGAPHVAVFLDLCST